MSVRSESTEQIDLIARVDWLLPGVARYVFAIPNGGLRSPKTAARLRREGVRPGVPDLFVALPRGEWHGLFIEMKRSKGSSTSPEQLDIHADYRAVGYRVEVCKSADAAWAVLKEYLRGDT